MTENIKFLIENTISLCLLIVAIVSVMLGLQEHRRRKNEEKKVDMLKELLGKVKGWEKLLQSAANANTLLRDHIRGTDDNGGQVTKFTSLDNVESAVDTLGAYSNGLYEGVKKELELIDQALKEQ